MPQLVIEQPGIPTMTIPIAGSEIRLGRAEDNDVVLVAEGVSRYHGKIWRKESQTVLTDMKSLNGTYVNRQRIAERILHHFDEIWFGNKCRLLYRDDTQYGRLDAAANAPEKANDSSLKQSIQEIRREMDQMDMNMTMIGQQAVRTGTVFLSDADALPHSTEDIVRMSRAYRRLSALYKAHQCIVSNFDLKTRLTEMLEAIMNVLQAKRGFVLLRERDSTALRALVSLKMGNDLNAKSPSVGIAGRAAMDGEPVLMQDRDSDREFGGRESIIANRIVSAMCVPLKVIDALLGSIYVDTDDPNLHFNEDDLELFSSLASQAALAIDNVRLHDRVVESEKRRTNLARFLPNALVEKILNESENLVLGGRKAQVTTLFCDIRGSSKIAESIDPQSLVALLNEHFTAMTEILFAYEGTLDKYIGDEIMAIFGAPITVGEEPFRAVCAALDMQQKNAALNALRLAEQRPQLHFGIGIESGEVIAGYIGSPKRMDFTVVGDRVNTAKRFCDMAAPGKIVIGEETYHMIKDRVETIAMGALTLKGKQLPVQGYEVVGLRRPDA